MRTNLFLGLFLVLPLLFSCNQDDDKRLEEVSGIQGQKTAEKQIAEENRNLAIKAEAMENELRLRTNFYLSLVGTYTGELDILGDKSIIELAIQPSYLPTTTDRLRTLDEIASDLNQVSLTFVIKHYNKNSKIVSAKCKIDGIKSDIHSGRFFVSEGCQNAYTFYLAGDDSFQEDPSSEAAIYAQEIYSSTQSTVPVLKGSLNPGATPGQYSFILNRVIP